jgi:hypothetical protein
MAVAPGGVGLPDLDERVAQRPPVAVEQAPGHGDALADRVAVVLARQVVVQRPGPQFAELRAGRLADGVRQVDERLRGMAQCRRPVLRDVQRRVDALVAHRR